MNDLIERWKVLNAIDSIESEIEDGYGFDYEKWKEHFSKMPSAQPRMKGRWIYGESEEGHDGYFCSQCGNFVPWIYKEFDIDFIKEFKLCPNCGADMR